MHEPMGIWGWIGFSFAAFLSSLGIVLAVLWVRSWLESKSTNVDVTQSRNHDQRRTRGQRGDRKSEADDTPTDV